MRRRVVHVHPPMTALGSVPKAHTQGEPEGTWNLEKLHLELKYLGRKLAEARLQRNKQAFVKLDSVTEIVHITKE